MAYTSFWVGGLESAEDLPKHLGLLYDSVGYSTFVKDPEVCVENELVPVGELIEPYSLPESAYQEAVETSAKEKFRLAAVVVAIYTAVPPKEKPSPLCGFGLKFIGTYWVNES